MNESIRLTVDGRVVSGQKGQTILEVARNAGLDIPTLCHHPRISRTGACRICLVRVNGTALKTACTEPAADGMNVVSEDAELASVRRSILEMLLAEGHHNCLFCDANGDCEFQDLCHRYGIEEPRQPLPGRRRTTDTTSSKGLRRNEDRCVLCGRCVKACGEVQMLGVWDFTGRGDRTELTADCGGPVGESSCALCGTCAQLCPTGALTLQPVNGTAPTWETRKQTSVCIYCGVGCQIDFHTDSKGRLLYANGNENGPNNGHLCVKGRFGFDFVQHPERIRTPLVRRDGKLVEASWEEALDYAAARLSEIKAANGPDSIAGLASAKVTNEENYLFQKFMRTGVGTNNVDHCARL